MKRDRNTTPKAPGLSPEVRRQRAQHDVTQDRARRKRAPLTLAAFALAGVLAAASIADRDRTLQQRADMITAMERQALGYIATGDQVQNGSEEFVITDDNNGATIISGRGLICTIGDIGVVAKDDLSTPSHAINAVVPESLDIPGVTVTDVADLSQIIRPKTPDSTQYIELVGLEGDPVIGRRDVIARPHLDPLYGFETLPRKGDVMFPADCLPEGAVPVAAK